jgi:hypothetical protein
MFVGHYGAAFVAKAVSPGLPLWLLLLAAQAVDVIFLGLVAVGVERMVLDPSLPSNPLDLQYMPISHGLLATVCWIAATYAVARRVAGQSRRSSAVLAAVVGSHWLLDLVVHRPDLPLISGEPRLGLGLWNHPLAALLLEEGWLLASLVVYLRFAAPEPRSRRLAITLVGVLALLHAVTLVMPHPDSVAVLLASMSVVFGAVTWAGYRVDRSQSPSLQSA